ncbi:hypothetical protein NDU88_001485 [Pleurodeles waltl]|uniref:CCHC-type domain-containing protein n=1 Tax=Pleurodeles waltl TaxID=8319 RepID=A0AAV7WNR4_PLEWA|nr:hypothetical protein NDU88_001485 [Pleurodeles waltl]
MATPTMSQPPPFLSDKGDPILPWKRWKNLFDSYLIAIGGEKFSPARKQAVLLHNLGIEGRNIYDSLEPLSIGGADGELRDVYEMSITILAAHFESKLNIVLERHTFFARSQGGTGSVGNVVAALRTVARTCDFGEITDYLIRDQLIRCTNNKRVQEKLLTKYPDLREAIAIVEGMESTSSWIKEMNHTEGDCLSVVQAPRNQEEVLKVSIDNKAQGSSQEKRRDIKVLRCYRCGNMGHTANNTNCFARNSLCRKCGKRGHYARVCNNDKNNVDLVTENVNKIVLCVEQGSDHSKHNINMVDEGPVIMPECS